MTARLICVTGKNNNKFYNMNQNDDGSITIEYGRIGQDGKKVHYPIGKKNWDTLMASKIRKGYRDVSDLMEGSVSSDNDLFAGISEKEVSDLLKYLTDCSKSIIKKNYLVAIDSVTEAQLKEAQSIIDKLVSELRIDGYLSRFNDLLLNLYTTLPRKMNNVKHYLIDSLMSERDLDTARKLIADEQSLLSTLESQVHKAPIAKASDPKQINMLDQMGVSIEIEKDMSMVKTIISYLGSNAQYAKNIYKVANHKTQKRFDDHITKAKNKETKLLWHGSRNENWIGIIQQGLMVRPANAITTGAMFGHGLYFANRAQKSLGYSSLRGSYWSGGSSNKGFLALFSTHTGNENIINRHDSSCYRLHDTMKNSQYDCVFAKRGMDLRNDEIIIYKTEATTISYIVEIEK